MTDISLRKPQTVSIEEAKVDDVAAAVDNGRAGTRTDDLLAYIWNVMKKLDRNGMNGHYLVMDIRRSRYMI